MARTAAKNRRIAEREPIKLIQRILDQMERLRLIQRTPSSTGRQVRYVAAQKEEQG